MGILNNLPVILAASTAFLAGLYGYMNHIPNSHVYQNMLLFLIIFYIIGLFFRRTLRGILEDMEEKAKLQAAEGELLLAEGGLNAIEAGEGAPEGSEAGDAGAPGIIGAPGIAGASGIIGAPGGVAMGDGGSPGGGGDVSGSGFGAGEDDAGGDGAFRDGINIYDEAVTGADAGMDGPDMDGADGIGAGYGNGAVEYMD